KTFSNVSLGSTLWGNVPLTATDTLASGITGSTTVLNGYFVLGPPTHLAILSAPSSAVAGQPFFVQVVAEDASNAPTLFTGSVSLASNAPAGSFSVSPASASLTGGVGSFLVTLDNVAGGPWTLTVKDNAASNPITSATTSVAVIPGAATFFTVTPAA